MKGGSVSARLVIPLCVACSSPSPVDPATSGGGAGSTGLGGQSGASGEAQGGAGNAGSSSGADGGSSGAGGGGAPAQTAGGGAGGQASGGGGGQPSGETPPEGVPESYRLVYAQSFAEASSLGELVFANPSEWRHHDDGYLESTGFSYTPMYRSPFSVAIVKAVKVSSFVMDVELLQTSPDGDAHRDMCLMWSFVGPSQFYYAHVSTAHDAVAHNIHIVNNADRSAISDSFTPGYDWGRNVWKRIRVVRDAGSGSMSVFDLDAPNEAILSASDTTFTEGYVGFGSFDNTGRVRNLKVWAADATPGNPDFFSPGR